jgi:glutaredoxin
MKYFTVICKSECYYSIMAKAKLITEEYDFQYICMDHSPQLLNFFKSNYSWQTVPIISLRDTENPDFEEFIGGYSDLIKWLEQEDNQRKIRPPSGESGV